MKCPICEERIHGEVTISKHFRFKHHFTTDHVVDIIFDEVTKLNDRVSNLCELLEVREK